MSDFREGDKVRVSFEGVIARHSINHDKVEYFIEEPFDGRHLLIPYYADFELIERADDPSKDPVGTVRKTRAGSGTAYVKVGPNKWTFVGQSATGRPDGDRQIRGRKVIGAVPGTPAAERQAADELSREQGDEEQRPEGCPFPIGTKVRGYRPSTGRWETGYLLPRSGCEKPGTVRVGKNLADEYGNHLRASDLERVEDALWTGDGSEEPPAHVKKVRDEDGDILERRGSGWWWTVGECVLDEPRDGEGSRWEWQVEDGSTYTEVRS